LKELWVKIDESTPRNVKNNILELAANVCDAVMVEGQDAEKAEKTGINVAASSGKCNIHVLDSFDEKKITKLKNLGKLVAVRVTVRGRDDEETTLKAARLSVNYVILDCPDWKVIPLENIIAKNRGRSKLLAEVSHFDEAKLALEALELGVDGVVLVTSDPSELNKTAALLRGQAPRIELLPVKIVEVKQIGTGARVCVDTCDLMKPGEGVLVGCQSAGFFLVEAEVHGNPYVEPRPFRVNAGSVSLYTLSSLSNTRYLSELKAGDEILIVDKEGNMRLANVGRVKIEFRPLLLIEAECSRRRIKTIVQNAETIRLVTENGSKSVTELKGGDEVLAYLTEGGGRHFGLLVKDETVIER